MIWWILLLIVSMIVVARATSTDCGPFGGFLIAMGCYGFLASAMMLARWCIYG